MQAINDSSRLVAQSLKLIKDYMVLNDDEKSSFLIEAKENLEKVLDMLATSIGT